MYLHDPRDEPPLSVFDSASPRPVNERRRRRRRRQPPPARRSGLIVAVGRPAVFAHPS